MMNQYNCMYGQVFHPQKEISRFLPNFNTLLNAFSIYMKSLILIRKPKIQILYDTLKEFNLFLLFICYSLSLSFHLFCCEFILTCSLTCVNKWIIDCFVAMLAS